MKKIIIFTLSFVLMICTLLASCNNELPKGTEDIVKAKLSSIDLMRETYLSAYNIIENVVNNGNITADGYKGISDNPDKVISNLENKISSINKAFDLLLDVNMDSSRLDKDSWEGRCAYELLRKMQDIQIVLSKPTPIETSGNKTKVWMFTELNSGYEFIASYNSKDDSRRVSLSEKGEEKLNKELSGYIENVNMIYNRYTEIVAAETIKREQRRAERRKNNPDGIDWMGLYFGD